MQIIAEWQGDFATTSSFQSFNTKYLLVPDWRAQDRSTARSQHERDSLKDPADTEEVKVTFVVALSPNIDFFDVDLCRVVQNSGC